MSLHLFSPIGNLYQIPLPSFEVSDILEMGIRLFVPFSPASVSLQQNLNGREEGMIIIIS
jgi:hypothetical protein